MGHTMVGDSRKPIKLSDTYLSQVLATSGFIQCHLCEHSFPDSQRRAWRMERDGKMFSKLWCICGEVATRQPCPFGCTQHCMWLNFPHLFSGYLRYIFHRLRIMPRSYPGFVLDAYNYWRCALTATTCGGSTST